MPVSGPWRTPWTAARSLQGGVSGQVGVGVLHGLGAGPAALVGHSLGVTPGRLGQRCRPNVSERVRADPAKPGPPAGPFEHLAGAMRAQRLTRTLPGQLHQHENSSQSAKTRKTRASSEANGASPRSRTWASTRLCSSSIARGGARFHPAAADERRGVRSPRAPSLRSRRRCSCRPRWTREYSRSSSAASRGGSGRRSPR